VSTSTSIANGACSSSLYLTIDREELREEGSLIIIIVIGFQAIAWCGWLAAGLIGGLSLFGLMTFEENGYVPGETSLRAAFFLAFRRIGWAVSVAWMIFACVHGKGGNIFLRP